MGSSGSPARLFSDSCCKAVDSKRWIRRRRSRKSLERSLERWANNPLCCRFGCARRRLRRCGLIQATTCSFHRLAAFSVHCQGLLPHCPALKLQALWPIFWVLRLLPSSAANRLAVSWRTICDPCEGFPGHPVFQLLLCGQEPQEHREGRLPSVSAGLARMRA